MRFTTFVSFGLLAGLSVHALPAAVKRDDPLPTGTTVAEEPLPTRATGTCPTGGEVYDGNCAITLKTTKDDKEIKFTIGENLEVNLNETIVGIDCKSDENCKSLGPIILRTYTPGEKDLVPADRKALETIGELKASGTVGEEEYTVMTGFPEGFVPFGKSKASNLGDAAKLATDEGKLYIEKFGLYHNISSTRNVWFKEEDGKLTAAKIVDWSHSEQVSDKDEAVKRLESDMSKAFKI